MAKILLVEDDNNLREIYEARLMAEGYDIVSARDGEEALTVAMKEKPDLVISDVMMPKISGFDMLDILRTTEETKNVKIIMMTALSQAEDKERAEKLGADRYLVKSQVTLEDVAKVAKEVLEGTSKPAATVPTTPAPQPTEPAQPVAQSTVAATEPTTSTTQPPSAVDSSSVNSSQPAPTPPAADPTPISTQIEEEEKAIAQQIEGMMGSTTPPATPDPAASAPVSTPMPAQPDTSAVSAAAETPATDSTAPAQNTTPAQPSPPAADNTPVAAATPSSEPVPETAAEIKTTKKVIEPINDLTQDMKPKLDELLEKEKAKEVAETGVVGPSELATPPPANETTSAAETPITPPNPDTKIDPNSIAL